MSVLRSFIVAVATIAAFFSCPAVQGDEAWEVFETGTKASLRGLAATSNEVAWACGSEGTIVQTVDGGKTWQRHLIPNLQAAEIRSIHAWDSNTAIVATAGQPALILKTIDRGITWKTTYENKSPQAFFDGMKFWSDTVGVAFSDPVDGGLLILKTIDCGDTWQAIEPTAIPKMDVGEAGFAASNSSLHAFGSNLAWIGLGGGTEGVSRVFCSKDGAAQWTAHQVSPIVRGASSGIFSIAFETELNGIAVGGDYNQVNLDTKNIALTEDGGLTWRAPSFNRPRGFRSSLVTLRLDSDVPTESRVVWLTCGPNGCDWSTDRERWFALSAIGFHSLNVGKGNAVWAAGSMGRVARLNATAMTWRPAD